MDNFDFSSPTSDGQRAYESNMDIDKLAPQTPITNAAAIRPQAGVTVSTSNAGAPRSFNDLPVEMITNIAKFLEPTVERHLSKPFDQILRGVRGLTPGNLHPRELSGIYLQSPTLETLRCDGGLAAWNNHRNLMNFALTCHKVFGSVNLQRVAVIYTPKQLVRFWLFVLEHPERRKCVEELQVHQYLFRCSQNASLREKLQNLHQTTGLKLDYVAGCIYNAVYNTESAGLRHTPAVVLSTALIHLLPRLNTLHIPYPRNMLPSRHHWKVLDFGHDENIRNITIARTASRMPTTAQGPSLSLNPITWHQLKTLHVSGVPHWQTFELSVLGDRMTKPRQPLSYWQILCTSPSLKGLVSLTLQRIGDPVVMEMSPLLSLPALKSLKLHTVNLDEEGVLRLLPAVPALEELEVFFTCDMRKPTESKTKQQELDRSLPIFSRGLRSLTIAYLFDPRIPSDPNIPSLNPSPDRLHEHCTSTIQPRQLLTNLDKLENLEFLGIDITNIINDVDFNMSALPPKLQHLRLYSATNLTRAELAHERRVYNQQPIEWGTEHYSHCLAALCRGLQRQWTNSGFDLRRVEFVRPLFLDEIVERARIDARIRADMGWSDALVQLAPQKEAWVLGRIKDAGRVIHQDCGARIAIMWSFEEQMGGDTITDRKDKLFFWGGH